MSFVFQENFRDLPEFVQDLPDEGAVLEAASMAVRDYQKGQLYQSNKTKMENYMKRRREDTRFNVQPKEDVLEKRKVCLLSKLKANLASLERLGKGLFQSISKN